MDQHISEKPDYWQYLPEIQGLNINKLKKILTIQNRQDNRN